MRSRSKENLFPISEESANTYQFIMEEEDPEAWAKSLKKRRQFMNRLFEVSKKYVSEAGTDKSKVRQDIARGFHNDDTTVGDTVLTGTSASSEDTSFTKAVRELRELPPFKYLVNLSKKSPFACGGCTAEDDDDEDTFDNKNTPKKFRNDAERLHFALFGNRKNSKTQYSFFGGDETFYSSPVTFDDTYDNSTLESYGPYRDYLSYDTETLPSKYEYTTGDDTETYASGTYASTDDSFDGYGTTDYETGTEGDTRDGYTTTDAETNDDGFEVTTFPMSAYEI